jgi:hypothetical protein
VYVERPDVAARLRAEMARLLDVHPSGLLILHVEAIPRTPVGKIDYHALERAHPSV